MGTYGNRGNRRVIVGEVARYQGALFKVDLYGFLRSQCFRQVGNFTRGLIYDSQLEGIRGNILEPELALRVGRGFYKFGQGKFSTGLVDHGQTDGNTCSRSFIGMVHSPCKSHRIFSLGSRSRYILVTASAQTKD